MDEKQFYKNLSYNLRTIRKGKAMSQEQFAILLNVSFYNYQRIEAPNTNQTVSVSLLLKICNKLSVELIDLIQDPRES